MSAQDDSGTPCPDASLPPYVADELLVLFHVPPSGAELDVFARRHGLRHDHRLYGSDWHLFGILDGTDAALKAKTVSKDAVVGSVNLNWLGEFFATGPWPSPDACPR